MIAPRSLLSLAVLAACVPAVADPPQFTERVIDPRAGDVVYAVTHADVNGDGQQDIVALTEDQVLCYHAPDWQKRVLLDGGTERDNVAIAPHDIDGDGRVDFAIAAGWLNGKNRGTLQWISRGPTGEEWKTHFIGAIPWTHRIRWADVLGKGTAQLVVSPLNAVDGDEGVALTAFEIPKQPKTDRWPATVMNDELNRMHNHWHVAAEDGDGFTVTLTASEEGISAIFPAPQVPTPPAAFVRVPLSPGANGAKPADRGAGEVKVGREADGRRLIATIEPMHGNQVVVYRGSADAVDGPSRPNFVRTVLDDTLGRGHGLWIADLNGDGREEVIAGHSEPATGEFKGPGVYYYQAEDNLADDTAGTTPSTHWSKQIVDDGGMACEDLFVLDLTGDGKPDIVAGGRNTHNVKLYVNQTE